MERRSFCALLGLALIGPGLTASTRGETVRLRPIGPSAGNAFAEACEASDVSRILFVSGQVPAHPDGTVPGDYRSQYLLAWANVERQLRAAGMSFDNLVKATIFLSDRALIAQSAGLRAEVLGQRTPAITIILAGIYDAEWLLEIEAIAVA